jgi:radical SAM-linked protein
LWLAIEGDLRFCSHRDCCRAIQRLLGRARLPVQFSRGFNPHPVFSLACPRPVGVVSRDDLLVLSLTEPRSAAAVIAPMNRHAPAGMRFLRARTLADRCRPRVRQVCYELPLPPGRAGQVSRRLEAFAEAESWPVERTPVGRRGRAARTVDLKRLVPHVELDAGLLRWGLAPQGDLWARPGEVLGAFGLDPQADLAGVVRTAVDYGI